MYARGWRVDAGGCIVVAYVSVTRPDVPEQTGYVRGEMRNGIVIEPLPGVDDSSLVIATFNLNMHGWLPPHVLTSRVILWRI